MLEDRIWLYEDPPEGFDPVSVSNARGKFLRNSFGFESLSDLDQDSTEKGDGATIPYPKDLPRIEILEVPPGMSEGFPRRELDSGEAISQFVSAFSQSHSRELSILGRVSDAVTAVARIQGMSSYEISSSVRLEASNDGGARNLTCVIETDKFNLFEEYFSGLAEWFGVRIAITPRVYGEPFYKCKTSPLTGQAGGAVGFAVPQFLTTCSHVIGEGCGSLIFKSALKEETMEPDVALLNITSPCYTPTVGGKVKTATEADMEKASGCPSLELSSRGDRCGEFLYYMDRATYGGRTHKCLHVAVRKHVKSVLDIVYWPLPALFSKKGDSGAWVLGRGDLWFGMVVGGSPFNKVSYVLEPQNLKNYLKLKLTNHTFEVVQRDAFEAWVQNK